MFLLEVPADAQTGIARNYVRDQGIADDPAVIFSDNFEGARSAIFSNWTTNDTNAVSHASDTPVGSAGTKSILIEPLGISGTLYKRLNEDHETLYLRYYIKYGASAYHHTGGFLGGYYPPTNWPQGDAGLKGIRPNGDRLIHVGFEERSGSRLDFYANWIDMRGDAFQGLYFGRSFVSDLALPIRTGNWQCVEFMLKMNSQVNNFDGELALWIDGELVVHFKPSSPNGFWAQNGAWNMNAGSPGFQGFQWRDTLNYGLNWVKIQNFDDTGAPDSVWFDDLVVATEYIGPLNSQAPDDIAPRAPVGLQIAQ